MQRIAIIGCCPKGYRFAYGAGKSTLAITLGIKLSLPVFHLDSYYWQQGWVETNQADWVKIQQKLIEGDNWIIDGNYGNTLEMRLKVSDTIIWLDFSTILCVWRVIIRYFQYKGRVRPDMALGCQERINLEFLRYVWNFSNQYQPKILAQLEKYQDSKEIIILQSPAQLKKFLGCTLIKIS